MSYCSRHIVGAKLLAGALLICLSLPAWSQKPVVSVEVELAEQKYRDAYGSDTTFIKQHGCNSLLRYLQFYFRFIDFRCAEEDPRYTLRISLSRSVPLSIDTMPFVTMWMILSSDRPGSVAYGGKPFNFLTPLPSDWEQFVEKLEMEFSAWLRDEQQEIVSQLLSHVKVSSAAYPLPDEMEWVVPWKRHTLELDEDTGLKIEATLSTPQRNDTLKYNTRLTSSTTTFHPEFPPLFQGKSIAEIEDILDNADINKMRDPNLKVEGIYLRSIRRVSLTSSDPSSRPIGGGL